MSLISVEDMVLVVPLDRGGGGGVDEGFGNEG